MCKKMSKISNIISKKAVLKKTLLLLFLPFGTLFMSSCDGIGDFGDMNENPTQVTSVPPEYQFTRIQLQAGGNREMISRGTYRHGGSVIQQVARTWHGGNEYSFNILNRDANSWYMQNAYTNQVKLIEDVVHMVQEMKDEGQDVDNLMAVSRIMRVYIYHELTDMYGDIPYFEAGKGYTDLNFTPVYDPQSEIYRDMLNELDEAVAQLDEDQPTYRSQDLFYDGSVSQWRRFGNSLRLRLALRLVKVDPATAEAEAVAAINAPGGLMRSNDDTAYIQKLDEEGTHSTDLRGNADFYVAAENLWNVSQTFIDWLKDKEDPRISVFAALVDGGYRGDLISTDPDSIVGLPNGWRTQDLNNDEHPSYEMVGDIHSDHNMSGSVENAYAKINPVMWQLDGPRFFLTYAQSSLHHAEAVARGWVGGDAAQLYEEGVRAALEQLELYGSDAVIPSDYIDDYLVRNALDENQAIKQINEQYWAASFLSFIEGWANTRRSGYPDLEPPRVDSDELPFNDETGGVVPRRMVYPVGEEMRNPDNMQEALNRQNITTGPSMITTPVWWDK